MVVAIPYSNDMWLDPANTVAKNIVLRENLTPASLQRPIYAPPPDRPGPPNEQKQPARRKAS